ncbi:MAG: amidohydrolase [Actinobacteria bacterium]|jgi:predicted amidohydrolase YtcJ|nr:MAG: amidohydrolase [Actinomycetota bacterium]
MGEEALLISGGDIVTMDEALPRAEAVAVSEGRIAAVGALDACRSALGGHYEAIDLKGGALLPGFIDTHIHPVLLIYFDMNLDLRGVTSIPGLQERIRAAAAALAPGEWLVGLQFDEESLREKRLPSRHDLDRASPDHPLAIIKHDGHTLVANTAAIAACSVGASTPDPEGGLIDREPGGYPAGPFREAAATILKDRLPLPDLQSFLAGAESAFLKLAACGITSVGAVLQTGEEGPAGAQGAFDITLMQLLLEKIPLSLYGMLIASDYGQVEAALQSALHQPDSGAGHRIGAVKIFADGTFGSRTAYMEEPYADDPHMHGFLTTPEEEIYRRMTMAHRAGLQVAIHAIGDAGNRVCVELFERLLAEHPRPHHRHRLEHASQLSRELISSMARLGIVVSTTPMYILSEKDWLHRRLGYERTKWTYPLRSLLEAGVKVAGASDGPIESTDVLRAVQCCVTREGFETQQSISAARALRMYTCDAAYSQFEEDVKGDISAGKRGDLVVLRANPLSVPPREIGDIPVELTIAGGKVIFDGGNIA